MSEESNFEFELIKGGLLQFLRNNFCTCIRYLINSTIYWRGHL